MNLKGVLIDRNSQQSVCIDRVRVVFAVLLVIRHGFAISLPSMPVSDLTLLNGIKLVIAAFLSDLIVPVYFFISGYLFFFGVNDLTWNVYSKKLKKRIKSILIPYLVWNAIGVALVLIKSLPLFSGFISYEGTELNISLSNILSCFWMYDGQLSPPPAGTENYASFVAKSPFPIDTALWYMRDLMIVTLLVPVLAYLLKRLGKWTVVGFLGLYFIFSFWYVDWHINQLLTAFLFFSWGAYMSMNSQEILPAFKPYMWVSIILYVVCSLGYLFLGASGEIAKLLKLINTVVIVVLAFNMVSRIPQQFLRKQLRYMGALCAFIYMAHCLVMPRVLKLCAVICSPQSDGEWICVYLLTIVATLLLLSLCFYLLKKYIPSSLKILIGKA